MKKVFLFFVIIISTTLYSQTNDTLVLDEIIINAEKIGINIQKIPASATSISGRQIENQNIENLTDLSAHVPNLFMPDYGTRLTSPIYIRGIGARINSPSVGLYVDNIPYFDKGSFNFEFFNIEKIEVLRGPQGTLNGRNTMGGLIKIYTLPPRKTRGGSFYTEYGNYNKLKSVLHYNLPVGEKFTAVVDASYSRGDGFFENVYNGKNPDRFDTWSAQIKLRYQPVENLKIEFTTNFEKNQQDGYPYALYDGESQKAEDINYNEESAYKRDMLSSGLHIEYKAPQFVVNSISSFQYIDDLQQIDQDFTPQSLFYVEQGRELNILSQEVNIHSKASSRIKWIAGVFGFIEHELKGVGVNIYSSNMVNSKDYDQTTSGTAAFAHATLPLGKFDIIAGIRFDYEKANLKYEYYRKMGENPPGLVKEFDNDLEFNEILPKIAVNYNITEDAMLYASVTKGYKAGNFNFSFEKDEDISFKPEHSINYELGAKTSFFNRKLIANFTVFYIDWKDQQIYQPVMPSGRGSLLKNAGHSESKGIEIELRSRVNRNIDLWLGFGYNEAKFLDYQRNDSTNYKGNYIPYIPKYTLNPGVNYKIYLNGFFNKMAINANYQLFGELYWNEQNTASQDAYGLLNGRFTLHSKILDFGVWGKNLLAADYQSFYFQAIGNEYVQPGSPLQIGAFVKVRF